LTAITLNHAYRKSGYRVICAMENLAQTKQELSPEAYEALKNAFDDFQVRAEKLADAFGNMQRDFRKVNLELDSKNVQLAESLKAQEEVQIYLSSILESMNNGVIGVDIMGNITHFNKAASEITGVAPDLALKKTYTDLFSHGEKNEQTLIEVLNSGKEHFRDEKVMWHKDGHPVPVLFQTAVLKDPRGRTLGAVEIFSDISRIKALEEQMQHTKTMAALGEMAATVAHEIRNPLGAMGMWAGLLERDMAPEDARRKLVNRILEGLSRLNRIVSNLLVYSRPVKAQFRKVSLRHILGETIDFVEIEAERQGHAIKIVKKWSEDDFCTVMADPEKIQQVIMNLCINSIQAMSEGGTLSVSIDKARKATAGYLSFCISDTGVGIPKEDMDKIFDPFYTTKANGTGLGLAIVNKIVEFHSGYIKLKSTVNKGTSVKVFLPSAKD
jgi:PAS domain S-box-containing protein